MEVNNLEFNSVETDLLYRLRISSKMPFPCPVSDSLNLGSVLSLQMAHINKADSHTSVSNLSTSPLRLYRHIGGVTLTTDPVLLVCWPDNRIQRKGGKVESTEQHGQSETGTGSLVGMCGQPLLQPAIFFIYWGVLVFEMLPLFLKVPVFLSYLPRRRGINLMFDLKKYTSGVQVI